MGGVGGSPGLAGATDSTFELGRQVGRQRHCQLTQPSGGSEPQIAVCDSTRVDTCVCRARDHAVSCTAPVPAGLGPAPTRRAQTTSDGRGPRLPRQGARTCRHARSARVGG